MLACLGENKYGGKTILAISIASSTPVGLSLFSEGSPYLIWNLPVLSKKILSILPTK
mgnify:FL=1